jgi:hypothetical protein
VLAQYPLGLVNELCDPRTGLARMREFSPTVACVVEWLDARLKHHQILARGKPLPAKPPEPDYSDAHRRAMLARLKAAIHSAFDGKDDKWVRPIGPFEDVNDKWNHRRKPANGVRHSAG